MQSPPGWVGDIGKRRRLYKRRSCDLLHLKEQRVPRPRGYGSAARGRGSVLADPGRAGVMDLSTGENFG